VVKRSSPFVYVLVLTLSGVLCRTSLSTQHRHVTDAVRQAFLGFDRNEYPGDQKLAELHKTFHYAGFWLNPPPGTNTNTWIGKREKLEAEGFGYLVLFNGRLDAELKRADAPALGKSDASLAALSATREGFGRGTLIFLDVEEGGRMLPEQKAYIYAWVDGIANAGFRSGIYCSGISAPEGNGVVVITAEDIRQNAGDRKISYWVVNDACPPSPGCALPRRPPAPAGSGVAFADVWQFAQSPRRRDFAAGCQNYQPDGNCYASSTDAASGLFLDLDTASSPDPSGGRKN
jgi:Domain of unknown function (DUF1906)